MRLLVRHPRPFQTESLFGYILRLSEENGFVTPWSLFRFAGMVQSEVVNHGFNFQKLANIINWSSLSSDNNAGDSVQSGRTGLADLAESFLLPELIHREAKFCPQCVEEKGFIEAHWGLPLMVACPTHGCMALFACPQCDRPLRWYRPGLLECKCGGDLRVANRPRITDREAILLDLVRAHVLRCAPRLDNPSAFPISDLMGMDTATLVSVINTVAKHRLTTDGCFPPSDQHQIINVAARVLEDWPRNFVLLLKDFGEVIRQQGKENMTARCKIMYRSLLSASDRSRRDQVDFMLRMMVEFAVDEWGFSDALQMEDFKYKLPMGLLSASQVAVQAKSRLLTTDPLCPPGPKVTKSGIEEREHLHDGRGGNEDRVDPTDRGLSERFLGVPQPLMQALIHGGVYQRHCLAPSVYGFHEWDLSEFRGRLLALAPSSSTSAFEASDCISLGRALSWRLDTPKEKVLLLEALLRRNLPVVGKSADTIGGLLIERHAYLKFMGDCRTRESEDTVGTQVAAKEIGCDRIMIPALVRLGYLLGIDRLSALRVEKGSLKRFKQNYVFLASVAKTLHTNTEGLARHCIRERIPVIWPRSTKRPAKHPFIRIRDLPTLTNAVERVRKHKEAALAFKRSEAAKLGRSRWRRLWSRYSQLCVTAVGSR